MKNVVSHPLDGHVVVLPEEVDSPAGLLPLLEQVLVVRVAPGPQGDGAVLPELARVRVDVDGHQTGRLGQEVDLQEEGGVVGR